MRSKHLSKGKCTVHAMETAAPGRPVPENAAKAAETANSTARKALQHRSVAAKSYPRMDCDSA
jgi:hypothetical protein